MEYTATWAAMEAMVSTGKVKSIGVSNFTVEQLQHLIGQVRRALLRVAFLRVASVIGETCASSR